MDTDGTFTYAVLKGGKVNRGISYETTSPYLRDCVVNLCAKLGIRTSVVAYRGANSTMDCYRVSMSTTDFSEFVGRSPAFVLHQKSKTERMKKVISTEGNVMAEGKADRVPYPTHLLSELAWARLSLSSSMRSHYMKVGDLPRSTALSMVEELIALDWSKYIQPSAIEMSRRTNRTPAEAFRLVMEWCDLVANNTLKWEKITKVSFKGREDAWDLTVPGPLTFVTSDGFVVQDTVTYYVPVSKKAVKDAYDKMMPSKNLLSARNFTAHYMPQEEYILGAYLSTRKGTGPVKRTFKTEQEAVQAYKRGEIDVDDNVQITG